jgi:hypothetical protein
MLQFCDSAMTPKVPHFPGFARPDLSLYRAGV